MAALDSVRSEFEFASQLLSDGRPFLCGSSLTAADITFVCLALPALNVPYAATAPLCDPNVFTPPLALAAAALELRGGICLCCLLPRALSHLLSRQNVFVLMIARVVDQLVIELQAPQQGPGRLRCTGASEALCCMSRSKRLRAPCNH